jgi:hypothetical protein
MSTACRTNRLGAYLSLAVRRAPGARSSTIGASETMSDAARARSAVLVPGDERAPITAGGGAAAG